MRRVARRNQPDRKRQPDRASTRTHDDIIASVSSPQGAGSTGRIGVVDRWLARNAEEETLGRAFLVVPSTRKAPDPNGG